MASETWIALDLPPEALSPQEEGSRLFECRVEGKRICVARHQGEWFALGGRCPHANGPLAAGWIDAEACAVVCPWHRFAFDLRSGQSSSGGFYVETYALRIEGNRLMIRMGKKGFNWWGTK
jgi:3-phenylpropionate/trans-cinnamate dioxygenase ferredoxin subunit